ncbi:MAG: O-antigen ligase family protein [Bacteroidales bacterium]|nr:O-antigen ligase family protein [Bacteroidales bacterium]
MIKPPTPTMEKRKLLWVYGLSAIFILLNTLFIARENFFFMAIPLFILVAMLFLFSMDKVVLGIAFLTPLAVGLPDSELGINVSIPTEPLLFGLLILFTVRLLLEGGLDRRIVRHPITVVILIQLGWMAITTITSELPWVSLKYLVSRLWFVVPMFFLGTQLFRDTANFRKFSWLYVSGLIIVIFFTIVKHASFGFDEDIGHWVMRPFYNDHTQYGALLAFFLPLMTVFSFSPHYSRSVRLAALLATGILFVALYLSFSRAAWISLVASIGVYILFSLRIRFHWIALSIVTIIVLFFSFQQQIVERLERNQQDSSTDLVEHIQSITNISSDASNLERINRWQSAIRMFNERPFWGWGPGTYQFVYAPYQHSQEKTIISTNAGDMGNAHSEYIGPLSESGVIGMLIVLLLAVLVIYYGLKVARRAASPTGRTLGLAATLALFSYFVHGILNNFLDSDKASVPFWAFIALIVVIDIYDRESASGT